MATLAYDLIWTVLTIILFKETGSNSQELSANIATLRGSTVSLKCGLENPRTLKSPSWMFGLDKVASYTRIVDDYTHKYEMNKSNDAQFDLIVRDVQLSDAGQYSCTGFNDVITMTMAAELIVFNSSMKCRESPTGDIAEQNYFNVNCTTIVSGRWTPRVHCQQVDVRGEVLSPLIGTLTLQYHSNSIVYQSTIQLTSSWNNTRVRCSMFFNLSDRTVNGNVDEYATNVPEFGATWQSQVMNIIYGPQSMRLDPIKKNSSIKCSAIGNPHPTIHWKHIGGDIIEQQAELRICRVAQHDLRHLQCIAIINVPGYRRESTLNLSSWRMMPNVTTLCDPSVSKSIAMDPTQKDPEQSTTLVYVCGMILAACVVSTTLLVIYAVRKIKRGAWINYAAPSLRIPDLVVSNSIELLTRPTRQDDDQYDGAHAGRLREPSELDNRGARYSVGYSDEAQPLQPLQPSVPEVAFDEQDGGMYAELAVRDVGANQFRCHSPRAPAVHAMAIYAAIDHEAASNLNRETGSGDVNGAKCAEHQ